MQNKVQWMIEFLLIVHCFLLKDGTDESLSHKC